MAFFFPSPASSKWNITIWDSTRQKSRSYLRRIPVPPSLGLLFNIFNCIFPPMQLRIVIFDFKEEVTGTEHVAIATSKYVRSGIFRRMQHPCQVSIALLHYWRRICVAPLHLDNRWFHQWLNLHNRKTWISLEQKKISQKKTPFYSTLKSLLNERNFELIYFSGHMHFEVAGNSLYSLILQS